jgi:two-component system OmpR family response regulator
MPLDAAPLPPEPWRGPVAMRILLVEDNPKVASFIEAGLKAEGHIVAHAADGRDGAGMALSEDFDAVVLDRMLPGGIDGLGILAAMRQAGKRTPVLILSALADVDERVKGLKAGGDDYLAKPFAFSELSARLAAIVRRAETPEAQTRLRVADLEIDLLARTARRGEHAIDLLPQEFRLLEYLMRHAGQVVTRTMLFENVWDYNFEPQSNIVDVHISRLRRKIDAQADRPLIHTVRNAGYVLRA